MLRPRQMRGRALLRDARRASLDYNVMERVQASMTELQGAIIGAAVIQVFIGYSGLMGALLRFISPITIAPTIALVGLALVDAGARPACPVGKRAADRWCTRVYAS